MARFIDEPLKNPLAGNEVFAATDPNTMDDVGITPLIITQFVATSMNLASGSTNGLIDGPSLAKLHALDTQGQLDTKFDNLAEVGIPIFIGNPVDGNVEIYEHPISVPWVFSSGYAKVSAGSTNVSVQKNGVSIVGYTNIPITTVTNPIFAGGADAQKTIFNGDVLGLTFTGTTGDCANMRLSLKAVSTI